MSLNIKKNGQLVKVAGSTVILDATASEIRSGTFSLSGTNWLTQNIIFDVPMPDTNYIVNVELASASGNVMTPWRITDKTVNGFTLAIYSNSSITYAGTYYAIRLVELEGYTELQNKVNNAMETVIEDSTNLVTSGAVYDAIQNATKIFIGTEQEWEDETEPEKYQVVIFTDKPNINAVDSTDGSTTVVGEPNKRWTGTQSEWNSLSATEKSQYEIVCFTDDDATGGSVVKTYVSNQINVGSNTSMTFTFSETIPKGKYLMHFNLICNSATDGVMNYTDEVLGTLNIHFVKTTSAISVCSADTACAITISSPTNTLTMAYSWASATTKATLFLTRIG